MHCGSVLGRARRVLAQGDGGSRFKQGCVHFKFLSSASAWAALGRRLSQASSPGTLLPQLTLFLLFLDSILQTGMEPMTMSSLYGDILQRSKKMDMRRKRFQKRPHSLMPVHWSICLRR